jgi:glyoxylase-like metal-dependent hydrolase (beta-lactamase superfamily II)
MTLEPQAFISREGARIYRIPLELFPTLQGFAHVVVAGDLRALIDVGSGFGDSNAQLEAGFTGLRSRFGEKLDWNDLTHILITHGHIDHFGGLPFVRERTSAPIGIHELDRRVLTGYEERLATVAGRLRRYLAEAGLEPQERSDLLDLHQLGKQLFASMPVDFGFEAVGMGIDGLEFVHVPGHSPGQVLILLDEVLFSGDHILSEISPHVAPERLSLNTGLGHYLDSLKRTRPLSDRTRLVLGGHNRPFTDLAARVDEIWNLYRKRLGQVLDLTATPRTIAEIADALFGQTGGYHRLLAVEEAGAYVEYLNQRGYLGLADLRQLEGEPSEGVRYLRLQNEPHRMPDLTESEIGGHHLRV